MVPQMAQKIMLISILAMALLAAGPAAAGPSGAAAGPSGALDELVAAAMGMQPAPAPGPSVSPLVAVGPAELTNCFSTSDLFGFAQASTSEITNLVNYTQLGSFPTQVGAVYSAVEWAPIPTAGGKR